MVCCQFRTGHLLNRLSSHSFRGREIEPIHRHDEFPIHGAHKSISHRSHVALRSPANSRGPRRTRRGALASRAPKPRRPQARNWASDPDSRSSHAHPEHSRAAMPPFHTLREMDSSSSPSICKSTKLSFVAVAISRRARSAATPIRSTTSHPCSGRSTRSGRRAPGGSCHTLRLRSTS